MRTLLLGAAAAFAVGAVVPAPAPQNPAGDEPPLRFRVAIDGQEHELTENEAKALRVGEREHQVRIVVEPLRRFAAAGLQFEYPRGMNFEHELGDNEQWTLEGPDVTFMIMRTPVAASVIAKGMLRIGKGEAPSPCKVVLGGKEYDGFTRRFSMGSTAMETTLVPIERAGGGVVVSLQDVLDDDRRSTECTALLALLAKTCVVATK